MEEIDARAWKCPKCRAHQGWVFYFEFALPVIGAVAASAAAATVIYSVMTSAAETAEQAYLALSDTVSTIQITQRIHSNDGSLDESINSPLVLTVELFAKSRHSGMTLGSQAVAVVSCHPDIDKSDDRDGHAFRTKVVAYRVNGPWRKANDGESNIAIPANGSLKVKVRVDPVSFPVPDGMTWQDARLLVSAGPVNWEADDDYLQFSEFPNEPSLDDVMLSDGARSGVPVSTE